MNQRFARKLLREFARYFLNNGIGADARRQFAPKLIAKTLEFEYIRWPKRLQPHVRGRRVLDVGCGMGLHGIGFVVSGVKSYTGCDPILDLESDIVKNQRTARRQQCGWTPREMMAVLPQLHYVAGSIDDLPRGQTFDVVVMHNTTEHLIEIARIFAAVHDRLDPDGLLVFNHHNFYAWNGHHLAPKNVSAIDTTDPRQRRVVDWGHLHADAELDEHLSTRVNRITLDDLRSLTERHFEIAEWHEQLSNETEGRSRLTEEILNANAPRTRRELETQSVYCVARKRADGIAVPARTGAA